MIKKFTLSLYLLLATMLSGCTPPPEKLALPTDIRSVVSLAPSITECLYAIGAGPQVIGVTTFCEFPDDAKKTVKVGGYTDTNYEQIFSLQPDAAVLLDEHIVAAERLEQLGIPHIKVDTSTIPAIFATLKTLGEKLNCSSQSQEVIASLQKRMAEIQAITADAPKRRVLISIGRNMGSGGLSDVYVAGQQTLYNEMLTLIGAENVYTGKLKYARMSHEAIMQLEPHTIIDLIPNLESSIKMTPEEVRAEWSILNRVPAVDNGQVYVFGEDYVCVPGPRFILVLEDIARSVYPEYFEDQP